EVAMPLRPDVRQPVVHLPGGADLPEGDLVVDELDVAMAPGLVGVGEPDQPARPDDVEVVEPVDMPGERLPRLEGTVPEPHPRVLEHQPRADLLDRSGRHGGLLAGARTGKPGPWAGPGERRPQATRGSSVGQTGTRPRPRWATGGSDAIRGSCSPPY